MVSWRVHEDKRHDALKAFSKMTADDDKKDIGDNVKLIGRWHDIQRFTGVAIFETEDPKAIARWILNWNHIIDADVAPVLDDEETREVGRKLLL
jgi:hypothetical protein